MFFSFIVCRINCIICCHLQYLRCLLHFTWPLFVLLVTEEYQHWLEIWRSIWRGLTKLEMHLLPSLQSSQCKSDEYLCRQLCKIFEILIQGNGLLMQSFKLLRLTQQACWMLYQLQNPTRTTAPRPIFYWFNQLKWWGKSHVFESVIHFMNCYFHDAGYWSWGGNKDVLESMRTVGSMTRALIINRHFKNMCW